MAIRLHPEATIGGQSAREMSESLRENTVCRHGQHPVHDTSFVKGRGAPLSDVQMAALISAGLAEADTDRVWLTAAGCGLKYAEFTPRFPRSVAMTALREIRSRISSLEMSGCRADEAWLFGSIIRDDEMVGDIDMVISITLRGAAPVSSGTYSPFDPAVKVYREALISELPPGLVSGVFVGLRMSRPGFECRRIFHNGARDDTYLERSPDILREQRVPILGDFDVDDPNHKYGHSINHDGVAVGDRAMNW